MYQFYRKNKFDRLWIGLILGLILPFIVSLIYFYLEFQHYSLASFYISLFTAGMLNKLMGICVVANLIPFLPFYYLRMDQALKGVVMATMIYGMSSAILIVF